MVEAAFKFNKIESEEQVKFQPESLSFSELKILAKRLQEYLEIYKYEEEINPRRKEYREAIAKTVSRVESILNTVKDKESLLAVLESVYELYESWTYLLKGEVLANYNDFLENEFSNVEDIKNEETVALEKEDKKPLANLSIVRELKIAKKEPDQELAMESLLEKKEEYVDNLFEIVENPSAALIEIESEKTPLLTELDKLKKQKVVYKYNIESVKERLLTAKGKVREKLERKLAAFYLKYENINRELLEANLNEFFIREENNLAAYLKSSIENADRNQKNVARLFHSYPQLFDTALPKESREKLSKQGILGKLLVNASMKNLIEYKLLGDLGGAGYKDILLTANLSPNQIRELASNGGHNYSVSNLGRKERLISQEIKAEDFEAADLKSLTQYLLAKKSNAYLNGESLDQDSEYESLAKVYKGKLEGAAELAESRVEKINNYLEKENTEAYNDLLKALKENKLKAEGARNFATFLSWWISNNKFRPVLDNLSFFDEEESFVDLTIREQFAADGVVLDKENMDLFEDPDVLAKKNIENNLNDLALGRYAEDDYSDENYRNEREDNFAKEHPLLTASTENISPAILDVAGEKVTATYEIDWRGDGNYRLKQDALRVLAMDIFPRERIEDLDGFSMNDATRLFRAVQIFNKLLQLEDVGSYEAKDLYPVMEMRAGKLFVKDYAALKKIANEIFTEDISKEELAFYKKMLNVVSPLLWEELLDVKLGTSK